MFIFKLNVIIVLINENRRPNGIINIIFLITLLNGNSGCNAFVAEIPTNKKFIANKPMNKYVFALLTSPSNDNMSGINVNTNIIAILLVSPLISVPSTNL